MKIHPKKLEELGKPNNVSRMCISRKGGMMRLIITTRSGYKFKTNFFPERELFESAKKEEPLIFV